MWPAGYCDRAVGRYMGLHVWLEMLSRALNVFVSACRLVVEEAALYHLITVAGPLTTLPDGTQTAKLLHKVAGSYPETDLACVVMHDGAEVRLWAVTLAS